MREWTETRREGTDMGPIDWDHELARKIPEDLRVKLREAEKDPNGWRYCPCGFSTFPILKVCMYDGWPYWRPRPAFLYRGPLGSGEWAFFDSYGVSAYSVFHQPAPASTNDADSAETER